METHIISMRHTYFLQHFKSWPRGAEFLTLLHCSRHIISTYSEVFLNDQPNQCGVGVSCFRDYPCHHHQWLMWWVLCLYAMFIHRAVIYPSPDGMGNGGQSDSDTLSICSLHWEHLIGHLDSCGLLLFKPDSQPTVPLGFQAGTRFHWPPNPINCYQHSVCRARQWLCV
jgi:hypothetical protein